MWGNGGDLDSGEIGQRWSGLSAFVDSLLENNFYRLLLCVATIGLIILYSVIGTQLAEPPLLLETEIVHPEVAPTSIPLNKDPWRLDQINRALARVDRIRYLMPSLPTPIRLSVDQNDADRLFHLESRVLRNWLDNALKTSGSGNGDLEVEAVILALLKLEFPSKARSLSSTEADSTSASWFESVGTVQDLCDVDRVEYRPASWEGICLALMKSESQNQRSKVPQWSTVRTPMSLVHWMANELVQDASQRPWTERVGLYSKWIATLQTESEIGWPEWPQDPKKYGMRLEYSLNRLAPQRASYFESQPRVRLLVSRSPDQLNPSGVSADTMILATCSSPRWRDLASVKARNFLWVRDCSSAMKFDLSVYETLKGRSVAEPWSERLENFAKEQSSLSFVDIGVSEVRLALEKGWIRHSDFVDVSIQFDGLTDSARPHDRIWQRRLNAYRFKSPVEVVRLVRIQSDS